MRKYAVCTYTGLGGGDKTLHARQNSIADQIWKWSEDNLVWADWMDGMQRMELERRAWDYELS